MECQSITLTRKQAHDKSINTKRTTVNTVGDKIKLTFCFVKSISFVKAIVMCIKMIFTAIKQKLKDFIVKRFLKTICKLYFVSYCSFYYLIECYCYFEYSATTCLAWPKHWKNYANPIPILVLFFPFQFIYNNFTITTCISHIICKDMKHVHSEAMMAKVN